MVGDGALGVTLARLAPGEPRQEVRLAQHGGLQVVLGDESRQELLDGSGNGTDDQANLYVVRPGAAPHYVGEIDSSIGKPPPAPPARSR